MPMEHYFSSEPTTKKIETEVSFEVDGVKFDMTAASGTFSSTKLDPGSESPESLSKVNNPKFEFRGSAVAID